MQTTGIYRAIDELGRIVLPIEIRKSLDLYEKDEMEILRDKNTIVLKKRENSCTLCKAKDNLNKINEKYICNNCISAIKNSNIK